MQLQSVETKISDLDARLSRIEGIAEQLTERMNNVEAELRAIRQDARQNMRWIVGIQLTTLVTLGTLILLKL